MGRIGKASQSTIPVSFPRYLVHSNQTITKGMQQKTHSIHMSNITITMQKE